MTKKLDFINCRKVAVARFFNRLLIGFAVFAATSGANNTQLLAAEAKQSSNFTRLIARIAAADANRCKSDPDKPQANINWLRSQLFFLVDKKVWGCRR